ncbi:MAG TPA: stage IV sporulation protein A [Bacillota bacterium]|nr:stage IV sporulation protein A [Bacillota bacterium]HOK68055.1 stage IV sporulation protein A [Bacillota bacterium]HPP85875.1 stage IV sporulation protein A [Bacillota bacterium]
MTDLGIYADIANRTGGDIYIGVVGPVRTGKSTLIKRFIEYLVLPNIEGDFVRERAKDEMPQSASGRTVMTTEPKFIPEEAVRIELDENASFRVKLIDCVGYIVPGAIGHIEDNAPRMVMTPWSPNPLPFEEAAELGTKKVIRDHSTIGLVVTTDGSIGDIPRESYINAEKRVVEELKAINKPFIVVLNCLNPQSPQSQALANELEQAYDVPVIPINCLDMTDSEIKEILKNVLYEFPVCEIKVNMPSWVDVLEDSSPLKQGIYEEIARCAGKLNRVGEIKDVFDSFSAENGAIKARLESLNLGEGSAKIEIKIPDKIFYQILGEKCGFEIEDEQSLFKIMNDLAKVKRNYDKVAAAIEQVNEEGYGIVTPSIEDLKLEEPEIVKQPGGYGVKLKASAPSIHMIKANIETEVSPMVGTERQSEELVKFLLKEFEEDPKKIWETNMFGKTLHELVGEGLNTKLQHMPLDARMKLSETLQKIINDGSSGLICILL